MVLSKVFPKSKRRHEEVVALSKDTFGRVLGCSSAQDKEQRFLLHHFEAGLATKTTTGWRGGVAYKELFFGPAKDGPEKQDGRRKVILAPALF